MKLTSFRLLIAPALLTLALALAPCSANAQQEGARKPSKADLKKYDANGDGQLDEAETVAMKEAYRKARLEKYDTNKDGKVDKEEKAAEDADKAAAKAEREAKKAAGKEAKKK